MPAKPRLAARAVAIAAGVDRRRAVLIALHCVTAALLTATVALAALDLF
ncbi:hypothetical protein [Sinorhizobium sp. BG8]|nr:hypothetical protein [Sinorhizobium sp. BG8]